MGGRWAGSGPPLWALTGAAGPGVERRGRWGPPIQTQLILTLALNTGFFELRELSQLLSLGGVQLGICF